MSHLLSNRRARRGRALAVCSVALGALALTACEAPTSSELTMADDADRAGRGSEGPSPRTPADETAESNLDQGREGFVPPSTSPAEPPAPGPTDAPPTVAPLEVERSDGALHITCGACSGEEGEAALSFDRVRVRITGDAVEPFDIVRPLVGAVVVSLAAPAGEPLPDGRYGYEVTPEITPPSVPPEEPAPRPTDGLTMREALRARALDPGSSPSPAPVDLRGRAGEPSPEGVGPVSSVSGTFSIASGAALEPEHEPSPFDQDPDHAK